MYKLINSEAVASCGASNYLSIPGGQIQFLVVNPNKYVVKCTNDKNTQPTK